MKEALKWKDIVCYEHMIFWFGYKLIFRVWITKIVWKGFWLTHRQLNSNLTHIHTCVTKNENQVSHQSPTILDIHLPKRWVQCPHSLHIPGLFGSGIFGFTRMIRVKGDLKKLISVNNFWFTYFSDWAVLNARLREYCHTWICHSSTTDRLTAWLKRAGQYKRLDSPFKQAHTMGLGKAHTMSKAHTLDKAYNKRKYFHCAPSPPLSAPSIVGTIVARW